MIKGKTKLKLDFYWVSFFLFIVGIVTFSDKVSTIKIFYMFSIFYALNCFIYISRAKFKIRIDKVAMCNIVFLIILGLSIFWQKTSAYYSSRLLTIFVIVFFSILTLQVLEAKKDIDIAIKCIIWANVVNCVYRLFTGGIKEVLGEYASSVPLIVGANDVAVALVVCFSFSIYMYRKFKSKSYIIASLLFLTVGIMTASRKALIGFALIIVIQYAFKDKKYIKNISIAILGIAVLIFLLTKIEVFSYSLNRALQLVGFMSGDESVVDASSMIRKEMRLVGLKAFVSNPILGYGVGYSYRCLPFGTYLHNNYIEVGVSLGLVGLLAFYMPHMYIIYNALKIKRNETLKITIIGILLAIFLIDYGAVMYFNKFYYIIIILLDVLVKNGRKYEGNFNGK